MDRNSWILEKVRPLDFFLSERGSRHLPPAVMNRRPKVPLIIKLGEATQMQMDRSGQNRVNRKEPLSIMLGRQRGRTPAAGAKKARLAKGGVPRRTAKIETPRGRPNSRLSSCEKGVFWQIRKKGGPKKRAAPGRPARGRGRLRAIPRQDLNEQKIRRAKEASKAAKTKCGEGHVIHKKLELQRFPKSL